MWPWNIAAGAQVSYNFRCNFVSYKNNGFIQEFSIVFYNHYIFIDQAATVLSILQQQASKWSQKTKSSFDIKIILVYPKNRHVLEQIQPHVRDPPDITNKAKRYNANRSLSPAVTGRPELDNNPPWKSVYEIKKLTKCIKIN